MRKHGLFFILCCFPLMVCSQSVQLSDSASISLITCDPADMAYALYGHTAIRVNDPAQDIDYAFNYGVFDFDSPNFLYRFTKGETDYILGVTLFAHFLREYKTRKSGVTEQVLNLSEKEKQQVWEALLENSKSENRMYRYNFLFDNCATRPRILLEKSVAGRIEYQQILPETTFRELIHHCNRNHRWLTFGIDLALGAPLDEPIGQEPQLFLPDKLMLVFEKASIVQSDGERKKLVSEVRQLIPHYPVEEKPVDSNPVVVCWIFFGVVALLSVLPISSIKYLRWLDFFIFFIYGLMGCVIAFLSFVSIHPCVFPNYTIVWLHPLHLVVAVMLFIRPCLRFVRYYMFINTLLLIAFLIVWKFIPQVFNPAFIPLVCVILLRALLYTFRNPVAFKKKFLVKKKRYRR